jgi:hypothetical protein
VQSHENFEEKLLFKTVQSGHDMPAELGARPG